MTVTATDDDRHATANPIDRHEYVPVNCQLCQLTAAAPGQIRNGLPLT